MFKKFLQFLQYHNAVNFVLALTFVVGAGTVFAATDEGIREAVADAVVKDTQTIVQIDNSAIVNTDLENFDARVRILEVEEDDFAYYATYQFTTLEVLDGRWQEVEKTDKMTVDKEALAGGDLGLYLAEELKELTEQELHYLKEVQEMERKKGTKNKKVAIEYSGLIGKLLDPKEETFDGYDRVVEEPEKREEVNVPEVVAEQQESESVTAQEQTEPLVSTEGELQETSAPEDEIATSTPSDTSGQESEEQASSTPDSQATTTTSTEVESTTSVDPASAPEQADDNNVADPTSGTEDAAQDESESSAPDSMGEQLIDSGLEDSGAQETEPTTDTTNGAE